METKCCSKCKVEKLVSEFPSDKSRKDGLFPWCQECRRADRRARYKEHGELIRQQNKESYFRNRENRLKVGAERYQQRRAIIVAVGLDKQRKYDSEGRRQCTQCGEWKPLTDFPKARNFPDGRRSYCRICYSFLAKEKYQRTRIVVLSKAKDKRIAEPILFSIQKRRTRLKTQYGLTEDQFWAMLESQQDHCLACKRLFTYKTAMDEPKVDHCHNSGKVRGLLCGWCNASLGMMRESAPHLRALARYAEVRC